jgi:serine phosphatase RsbU (regulator of sigma subunit)
MASLRYATRAYAAEGYPPARILAGLNGLVSVANDGHFATVLCAKVDVTNHSVEIANAGHLSPVVLADGIGHVITTRIGPPVGVRSQHGYEAEILHVPRKATVLAFTDGLVERRGEPVDKGISRLVEYANRAERSLDVLLDDLLSELIPADVEDDTAILGIRWTE